MNTQATDSAQTYNANDPAVIYVEDYPGLREMAQELFGLEGIKLDVAEDGTRGLQKILERNQAGKPYKFIISDMDVPGKNEGVFVYLGSGKPKEFVFYSGNSRQDVINACKENGIPEDEAPVSFEKPNEFYTLLEYVKERI